MLPTSGKRVVERYCVIHTNRGEISRYLRSEEFEDVTRVKIGLPDFIDNENFEKGNSVDKSDDGGYDDNNAYDDSNDDNVDGYNEYNDEDVAA